MSEAPGLQERFEARLQAMHDAENIKCPACGYVWDQESLHPHITYWGENGPKDDECPNCETALTIEEHVTRTFEVTMKADKESEKTEHTAGQSGHP